VRGGTNSAGRVPELRNGVLQADLLVIGAGSAGLSVAAGAVQMGASVVLVEKAKMGGDCLNTGCVPSKALIAAAHAANAIRSAGRFGVRTSNPSIDFAAVHDHVHQVIAKIAVHDSVERFEGLGVTVMQGAARFVAPHVVAVRDRKITARRIVIATGSKAAVPPIPGLSDVPCLTNETVFDLKNLPQRLIVIGGGPIGVEMAQAFRRLGSEVCVVEQFGLLAKDEPEAVEIVRKRLAFEGVSIHEQTSVLHAKRNGDAVEISIKTASGETAVVPGTHILVAAGRTPNVAELGLEEAGIAFGAKGIQVDRRMRTNNRRAFAIGDVAAGPQFTHIAGYHAGIVIRNALFALPVKAEYVAMPWVTYTDPELAHVGLTEAMARGEGHDVRVLRWQLSMNDRAQTERDSEGLAKIVVGRRGRILGATIVAPRAGELIGMWGLAIAGGLKIGAIASMIAPYPTFSEISKRVAGSYYTPSLFSSRTRSIVGFIQRFLP
jgi:pyruvate/2-oxoglutarate dehydrogenase complex dihydrolipoamide dehydrogenase (E3) component